MIHEIITSSHPANVILVVLVAAAAHRVSGSGRHSFFQEIMTICKLNRVANECSEFTTNL